MPVISKASAVILLLAWLLLPAVSAQTFAPPPPAPSSAPTLAPPVSPQLAPPAAPPQRPAADDIFTVGDIPVDVTDATAMQARDKALAEGQRTAFARLVQRLATDPNARVPRLDERTLNSVVRSFDIAGERTSPVRYIATLTVRFSAAAVREVLTNAGIAFTETKARPTLVLPVYVAQGSTSLFEDGNPWREAWARRPARDTLAPLVVPVGDLQDVGAIDAAAAVAGDRQKLDAIARRHGAVDVLVAVARLVAELPGSKPSVSVSATRHTTSGDTTLVESFAGDNEELAAVLAKAADWVAAELERQWKQENAITPGLESRQITISVPIESLDEWVEIRRRLTGIGIVRKAEVLQLRRREARIAVTFSGEMAQLKSALAQRDLELVDSDEPVLRLSGPARR